MSALIEDTSLLLALPSDADSELEDVSRTVITLLSLKVKAEVYQQRLDRALRTAAAAGATTQQLADSAGLSMEEVRSRIGEPASSAPTPPGEPDPVVEETIQLGESRGWFRRSHSHRAA